MRSHNPDVWSWRRDPARGLGVFGGEGVVTKHPPSQLYELWMNVRWFYNHEGRQKISSSIPDIIGSVSRVLSVGVVLQRAAVGLKPS